MRLFYDEYTTRPRSEALLLLCDMASLSIAILFATGAADRLTQKPWDVALLVVWACIPRALAKGLAWMEQPSFGYRTYAFCVGLTLLIALLLTAGWETLSSVTRGKPRLELTSALPIFLAWSSALALFQARAYLLHDFLLWAVILSGLKDSRAHPHVWLPLFFCATFLSSTLRQLLHGVFADVKRPPVNVQNARTATWLAAGAATLVFWTAYGAIHGGLDVPLHPGGRDEPVRSGSVAALEQGEDPAGSMHAAASFRDSGAPGSSASGSKKPVSAPGSVGFTYRVALKDLSLARLDAREVLRVRPRDESGAKLLRPPSSLHWKAVSFSRFDPEDGSWTEETQLERKPWPDHGRVDRAVPASMRETAAAELECRIITPVCRNLVQPYFTSSLESKAFLSYLETALGDVFPHPAPAPGTRYLALTLRSDARTFPGKPTAGRHEDARYVELPPARELGVDLSAHARRIFAGGGEDVPGKVRSLERYFARGFRYSQNALWRSGKSPLAAFLEDEKVGNCTYFATASALLLRAAGVSTRLAAGFLGTEWDEAGGEAVIRDRTAHAWIEVYLPGDGWHPVDPTLWVPLDRDFQLPQDEVDVQTEVIAGSTRLEPELEAPEVEGRSPRLPPSTAAGGPRERPGKSRPERDGDAVDGLPEGVEPQEEDGGSWIEYSPEPQLVHRTAQEPVPSVLEGGDEPYAGRTEGLEDGLESEEPIDPDEPAGGGGFGVDPARLRVLLRAAIALIGAIALGLLVVSFLRPKRAEEAGAPEEEAAPDEDGRETGDVVIANLDERVPAERVLIEYVRLQQALERTRSHRRSHQTPLEHGRAVTRGRDEVAEAFQGLHRTLYRILYAGKDVDEAEAALAVKCCRRLRKLLG